MTDPKDVEILRLRDELEKAQHDVDEVLASTKDIELQLEQDVEQAEKQLEKVRRRNFDLQDDLNEAKSRLSQAQVDHEKDISKLLRELEVLRSSYDLIRGRLRDEEMRHDDLERQERIVKMSYNDLENKYHEALERIAHLDSELGEYAEVQVENQRLKDELRDLSAEMTINRQRRAHQDEVSSLHGRVAIASLSVSVAQTQVDSDRDSQSSTQRPASRIATTNSVRNLQSLSSTITALREKMKAAREVSISDVSILARRMSIRTSPEHALRVMSPSLSLTPSSSETKQIASARAVQTRKTEVRKSLPNTRRQSGIPALGRVCSPERGNATAQPIGQTFKTPVKQSLRQTDGLIARSPSKSYSTPATGHTTRRRTIFSVSNSISPLKFPGTRVADRVASKATLNDNSALRKPQAGS